MQTDMHYVYTIYQEGSFSKAAEKLYMTQPALSIAIRKIEAEAGIPLFDRKTRPLQPTEAGKVYIHAIEQMRYVEEDRDRAIQDIRDLKTGTLRIGGSHYLNAYILPKILTEFSRLYPGIQLELVEYSSAELCSMLEERKIDVTFSCNPILIDQFRSTPMFSDHILLAAASGHPFHKSHSEYALSTEDILEKRHLQSECPQLPISCFSDCEFILLSPGNNLHDRAWAIFRDAGFEPHVKMELSQLATAYHLTVSDFGVTFISDLMITHPNIPLRYYKINSPLTERRFYAILPNQDYIPVSVRKFIEFVSKKTNMSNHG